MLVNLALAANAQAAAHELLGVRLSTAPDSTRLVFDISGPAQYRLFRLSGPDRVVIDFSQTRVRSGLSPVSDGLVRGVRHAVRPGGDLRVVLDVHGQTQVKHFLVGPEGSQGHRLVVDLAGASGSKRPVTAAAPAASAPASTTARTPAPAAASPEIKRSVQDIVKPRQLVIAIDAGHGGADPGAIGASGLREKDVVLAIARRLQKLVEAETGMRPVMIRDGDYFVSLRQRTRKARENKADLFVSIHADAFHDRRVRGSSLFVLSQNGASSEAARWLAARENAADLVGGVTLDDKEDDVASVLLDLSRDSTMLESHKVAKTILQRMGPIGKLHRPTVQQAGFAVLKSLDVPSVLVETAFISNPDDEAKLRDARHQQQIAQAIFDGIREYFTRNPPDGTVYAMRREHTIARGDTLSQIAQQYRISVEQLRAVNGLKDDRVQVGQVLQIPGS
jgi:N-acetylmuramoyl-L-alanine amidase